MHEACLGVSCWCQGETLGHGDILAGKALAHGQRRQDVGAFRLRLQSIVVGRLAIHFQESVEDHYLAVCHEMLRTIVHVHHRRGLLYLGLSHL